MIKSIISCLIFFALLNGCYYDNNDELHPAITPCDTTGTISFANDIEPIMLHSCGSQNSGCHLTTSSLSSYGLESYDAVIFTIDDSNTFLESITHSSTISSSKWMPKNSSAKIDDCSIQKIEAWMNRGRSNN